MIDLEQIIDEIAHRLKKGSDISFWQNNPQLSPIANLLSKLAFFPKARIPTANFERVKNQILDRISVPADMDKVAPRAGFFATLPSMMKLVSGIAGTLLIVVSLGAGVAVAALQSGPGDPLYSMKKTVENIELALTRDPAARANLQIQFANNRLDELATVIEKNQSGEISNDETQKILSQAVSEIQKSTSAALNTTKSSATNKQASTLNKVVDLSNKQAAVLKPLLSAASIRNDGEVKIVVEQALQTSQISKEQAIKNIENAGLVVEDQPITLTDIPNNQVTANGAITALTSDYVSIGTSKFIVTKDTKYDNIKSAELKVGTTVKISGEVRDDKKTYAVTIAAVDTTQTSSDTSTDTKENQDTTVTP